MIVMFVMIDSDHMLAKVQWSKWSQSQSTEQQSKSLIIFDNIYCLVIITHQNIWNRSDWILAITIQQQHSNFFS